jgi:PST family polysaccharide transporter
MKDLKQRTIRGGLAKIGTQFFNAALRIGSVMVLARLLVPEDFGLIGMVTALVGVLNLFRDFGLSTATVQRASVTDEQISTLFWINVVVGLALMLMTLAGAPAIAALYREPRLVPICAALSINFLINAVGIQHSALLQREMRFPQLSLIETLAQVSSIAVGIAAAVFGLGHWSLVAMQLAATAVYTVSVWTASGWLPNSPRWAPGVVSMVSTGGIITANGIVVYIAYNLEKVLLGRFFGAEALGVYGRAYQLANIPTENLNSAVGAVAISALSRVKDEPIRLRSYFLKGYSLLLALTVPITTLSILFAEDLIFVVLGPKWGAAAAVFRFLAPTILIFGIINPLWPLMVAQGLLVRSAKLALAIAPVAITGYLAGISWGPKGVAIGFSSAMALWAGPHVVLCVRGTVVSAKDIALRTGGPLLAAAVAAGPAWGVAHTMPAAEAHLLRLALAGATFAAVYALVLLYGLGQRSLYVEIWRGLRSR